MTTALTPATGLDGRQWLLAEPFLLRVAGFPYDVAEQMGTPGLLGWAERMLELEGALASHGDEVVGALERLIGLTPQGPVRSALVSLKRDVFNGRRPRPATLQQSADALDGSTSAALQAWLDARAQLEEGRQAGGEVLSGELAERRAQIRELAASPVLQSAILLQSPTLYDDVRRYLRRGDRKPDKRGRRVERTLLTYVYRAACKTSPFSTLTSVSQGGFVGDPEAPAFPVPDAFDARSGIRLNVAILNRLTAALLGSDTARPDLPVQLTSGWTADAERVRYLRKVSTISDDRGGAVTIDPVHESMFFLPSGDLLRDLLEHLPSGESLRFGDLAERLAALDPAGRPLRDVQRYLHHLVRLGLLIVPPLQIAMHSRDPLHEYRAGLERLDRGWAADVAARLGRVQEALAGYVDADPGARHAALSTCRSELEATFSTLGREDLKVPRTVAYEDASMPGSGMRLDRDRWQGEVLADLQSFARILPAFDINLGRRLVTKGFFRARYGEGGTCDDLLQFTHEFQRDFFDPYTQRLMRRRAWVDGSYVPQENWFKLDEIEAVDQARVAVADAVREAYAELPEGAEELHLSREAVDRIAATIPDSVAELSTWGVLAQVTAGEDPLVVVNRVTGGLGMLYTRFAHCFADDPAPTLEERLRRGLAAQCPPGAVLAELRGFDGSNLNLHPHVTDYEIVCPGEVSDRPADEQIHVDELVIRDDVERDRLLLWSERLGCEVIPCYLGLMMPLSLPELQQVLLTFSMIASAQIDLWMGTDVPLPGETIADYPRLRFGNVVFHRRLWKLHPDYFPQRDPETGDHEYFLEVARWRRDNGLPRRVFVTPDQTLPVPAAEQADDDEDDEAAANREPEADGGNVGYKPLWIDFDSYLSVGLLERYVQQAGRRLVMTEMLPGPDDLWLRDGDSRYVSEMVFELGGLRS